MFSILTILLVTLPCMASELRWDWSLINPTQVEFKKDFLWGVGVSEYQVSGARNLPDSNWAYWEQKLHHQSGKACDHINNLPQTIECIKKLGVKAFRFSIDWSLIEPWEGGFDSNALKLYKQFCIDLKNNGIEPIVTLHHFAHPEWFEKKGAFEKAENIGHFVRFCARVFNELSGIVTTWCTINEPGVYAFQGYVRGVFPPGKHDIFLAGKVLCNLCRAHVEVYKLLKLLPNGDKARIGLVHNILQFEPYHTHNKLELTVCSYLNMILNDAVLNFFKTGIFEYSIAKPLLRPIHYESELTKTSLDFIGLNYYSHVLWNWKSPGKESYRKDAIKTDMPYPLYPEGLYRAIKTISVLNVPIYITENGIADSLDDRRELWIQRYTYAVHKAIEEGCDVRGFFYWSLMDNFEWDEGFAKCFGLFHVNFETGERTLRDGSQYFVDLVHKTHNII